MKKLIVIIIIVIGFLTFFYVMAFKIGYTKGQAYEMNNCADLIDSLGDTFIIHPTDSVVCDSTVTLPDVGAYEFGEEPWKPVEDWEPEEEVYLCKYCGEPLFKQPQGRWVHATFESSGYISCEDHKNKKFDRNRQGETTYAEPLDLTDGHYFRNTTDCNGALVASHFKITQYINAITAGHCLETGVWQDNPHRLLMFNLVFDGYDWNRRFEYPFHDEVKVINDSVKLAQYQLAERFIKRIK